MDQFSGVPDADEQDELNHHEQEGEHLARQRVHRVIKPKRGDVAL
ncbi:MAG: hypothetical protein P8Y80_05040 [Acidobacteriota bacterium]